MSSSAMVAPGGTLVYVLLPDRAEFDRLALPVTDHGDKGEKGHVLSKAIDGPVYVVFQHWVNSPALPELRRASAEASP